MTRALALAAVFAIAPVGAAGAAVTQPRDPIGVVVLVPGSGFNGADSGNAERMSLRVPTWRRWGLRTVIAEYRRGRAGLLDVRRALRRARASTPELPLTVYGESSGGTWSLLAAADGLVDRAVVFAAPTDQETLAASKQRLARHLGGDVWPRYFGDADEDNMFEPFDVWSEGPPLLPLLLAYSRGDGIVPPQQGELLAGTDPAIGLQVLDSGKHQFVHAQVDPVDFVTLRRAVRRLATAAR
jgi:hypothetical protein